MESRLSRDKIKELCDEVEGSFGMKATTPKHFERLAVLIFERTGTLLSPTTLKRIWGYLQEGSTPRRTTLDLLAQCCGWRSYDDFAEGDVPEIESGFVGAKILNVERDLKYGEIVRLMWHPARVCVIKYLGNGNWEVIRSEGTRLLPGDTFRCRMIVAGEPLYLENLIHAGGKPGVYVCGRNHGIGFLVGIEE